MVVFMVFWEFGLHDTQSKLTRKVFIMFMQRVMAMDNRESMPVKRPVTLIVHLYKNVKFSSSLPF